MIAKMVAMIPIRLHDCWSTSGGSVPHRDRDVDADGVAALRTRFSGMAFLALS